MSLRLKSLSFWLAIFFLALSLAMIGLVVDTSLKSNLFEAWPDLVKHPWFNTTLIDFYFNIAILSVWVFYRERCPGWATIWTVGFICLGSIVTAFYVFLQLIALKPGEPLMNAVIRKDKAIC